MVYRYIFFKNSIPYRLSVNSLSVKIKLMECGIMLPVLFGSNPFTAETHPLVFPALITYFYHTFL